MTITNDPKTDPVGEMLARMEARLDKALAEPARRGSGIDRQDMDGLIAALVDLEQRICQIRRQLLMQDDAPAAVIRYYAFVDSLRAVYELAARVPTEG
jgi:hypothetical protein